jgi:hypothetical protein
MMAQRVKTGGRTKGTPNRSTADVRKVIAAFAEANAGLMHEKLNQIEDPAKWMDSYLRAIEYHIPKLGRTELTGADGEKLSVSVQINRTVKERE